MPPHALLPPSVLDTVFSSTSINQWSCLFLALRLHYFIFLYSQTHLTWRHQKHWWQLNFDIILPSQTSQHQGKRNSSMIWEDTSSIQTSPNASVEEGIIFPPMSQPPVTLAMSSEAGFQKLVRWSFPLSFILILNILHSLLPSLPVFSCASCWSYHGLHNKTPGLFTFLLLL